MIGLMRRVVDGGEDVLAFELRVVLEDFLKARAMADEFQDVGYADAQATNAGASAALGVVDGNALETVLGHGGTRSVYYVIPPSACAVTRW